jgi:hypothetical protein
VILWAAAAADYKTCLISQIVGGQEKAKRLSQCHKTVERTIR